MLSQLSPQADTQPSDKSILGTAELFWPVCLFPYTREKQHSSPQRAPPATELSEGQVCWLRISVWSPAASGILRDQEAARPAVGVSPSGMWQGFLDGLPARHREDSHLFSRHSCPNCPLWWTAWQQARKVPFLFAITSSFSLLTKQ